MKETSETSVEYLKRRIGLRIVELADDADALDETGDDRCMKAIKSFRKAAAEWVYELLKETTKYYAKGERLPDFIVTDSEEKWASALFEDVVEKHIGP